MIKDHHNIAMNHLTPTKRLNIPEGIVAAAILFTSLSTLLWCIPPTRTMLFSLLYYLNPLMNLFTAVLMFLVAIRERRNSHPIQATFVLFGIAYLCTFFGDVVLGIVQKGPILSKQVHLFHILYFLYYPMILIGILHLPVIKLRQMERVRKTIEVFSILLALILIYWNFLYAPTWDQSNGRFNLPEVIQSFFPFTGLILLFGVMSLSERLTHRISSIFAVVFASSMVVMIVTDGFFSWQVLNDSYQPTSFLQIGWLFSSFLGLVAGFIQLHHGERGTHLETVQRKVDLSIKNYQSKFIYIPYVYLIGIYIFLIQSHFSPMAVGFTPFAIVLGIILLLVILQQTLSMRDNQHLNEELMFALQTNQVRQDDLLRLNQALQIEITERKNLEKQLKHDVLHDPLTGLPNRVLFLDRLGQAIELTIRHPQTNYAVLFLDLDQFKPVNDEFGHLCGDRLLVEVSRRLFNSLRSTDTVARLGGDEFVFLLEGVTPERIPELLERIKNELNPPISMLGHTFSITASIGVVDSLRTYYSAEQVLRDADLAMYTSKSKGNDGYSIYSKTE